MKAIGKYILIKIANEEERTESGLLLSGKDSSSFRYARGVVVEPGTLVEAIKKDDTIYYDKSASFTMLINEQQYTIIQERDVVVVV